jgi:hypothetical protein
MLSPRDIVVESIYVSDPETVRLPPIVVLPDTARLVPTVSLPAAATRPEALTVPAANAVIVPNDVREEEVTPEASADPERVPAGATTTDVDIAVTNPFAFTVTDGIAVELPNAPTLELTVARVVAFPTLVTSPVKFAFVVTLDAVNAVAVPVIFVPTNADGVPSAGVISVGLVARTTEPVPVTAVIPVPLILNTLPVPAVSKVLFVNVSVLDAVNVAAAVAPQYTVVPLDFKAYPELPREPFADNDPISVLAFDASSLLVTVALLVEVLPDTARFVDIVARPV